MQMFATRSINENKYLRNSKLFLNDEEAEEDANLTDADEFEECCFSKRSANIQLGNKTLLEEAFETSEKNKDKGEKDK